MATSIVSFLTGETSKTSIVPDSFSLTIVTDVIKAHIIINMSPITPGTKLYELFNCGLYNILTLVVKPACGCAMPSNSSAKKSFTA